MSKFTKESFDDFFENTEYKVGRPNQTDPLDEILFTYPTNTESDRVKAKAAINAEIAKAVLKQTIRIEDGLKAIGATTIEGINQSSFTQGAVRHYFDSLKAELELPHEI